MELELKHIAPYLPYELKAQDERTKEIRTVTWLHFTYGMNTVGMNHLLFEGLIISKSKPILRPMSDLIKKIDIEENTIIPLQSICRLFAYREQYQKQWSFFFDNGSYSVKAEDQIMTRTFSYDPTEKSFYLYNIRDQEYGFHIKQQDCFNKLFEWHFDVFGLIEKGLAIDINTL